MRLRGDRAFPTCSSDKLIKATHTDVEAPTISLPEPAVPRLPPLDGSLFFSDLIDFHMHHNPTLSIWTFPHDKSTIEITFLEFGRAAHRVAHALRPERAENDGQVVMLIATTDTILHQIVVVGMAIAGLVPFPVSPRNSPAAVVNMMRKVHCSRIVSLSDVHRSLINAIREQCPDFAFTVEEMPSLSDVLVRDDDANAFIPYPHSLCRPDPNSPAIYIHSSGSTGFPKPIPQSYKTQIHWMYHLMAAYFHGLSPGDRVGAMALPPFHSLGITMQLYLPLAYLVTVALYPPQATRCASSLPIVPTSDNILDAVSRTRCKAVIVVPMFLEQWAVSPDAVEALTKLDRVIYGGGPLVDRIGDALWAAGVNISIAYGGTEFGSPLSARHRSEVDHGEWMWVRFSENIQVRCVPHDDSMYECQILTTDNYQVSVENLADVKGYATSDLFIKHPTKNLWKIVSRMDDVITLASGEKIVPIAMESIITTCPLVQGVVMFGRERNQVGVLVEPSFKYDVDVLDGNAVATFRNQIWPAIEDANKMAPAFARIFKEMILVVDAKHPMIRTPKGTVQKKATLNAYEAKINLLYSDMEATFSTSGESRPTSWTIGDVLAWLTVHANLISQGRKLDPSTDLFAQGFDSLSVTYLRNRIINALRTSNLQAQSSVSLVSPNIIYENPILQLLAARISNLVCEHESCRVSNMEQQHVAEMNDMIKRYSIGLPGPVVLPVVTHVTNGLVSHSSGAVVLLTGSTGGLGSFLLASLLQDSRVEKVYALNRPSSLTSVAKRQRSSFIDKDLSLDLLDSKKLVYVEADASRERCGLSSKLYEEICGSVTVFIHSAWRLDFNLSLASFETNVKATRNLVHLALDAKHQSLLRFIFMSSVATAQSWDLNKGTFPEELQLDPSTAVGLGYGESKYVCERIIAHSGLRATSLRMGQIAGGLNGSWALTDWVPIIVKSSIALGAIPSSAGVVSWMRSEDVAGAVMDVAFADSAPQSLNLVNPQPARWSDMMSFIRDSIMEQKSWHKDSLTMVPLTEWVALLEKRAAHPSSEDLANIPALKLMEFLRTLARIEEDRTHCGESVFETGIAVSFSTTEAQLVSSTLRRMRPVGETEARAWTRYWISKRLF